MTEQQKDFVHMYLKHRDKIIAHNIVYGDTGNYDAAESSANRLLRIPEIEETIRSIQDGIRHEVEEEFKAKYREELMSMYEKRLLLKKIATGELYVEQKYKGKNCTQCSQYISPTINQMLAAIREDSKLAGHYPHKQNGKWVIPALQTEQEQEEIISTLEKDNNRQQTKVLSPAVVSQPPVGGGGVSLSADGGGTFALNELDEKDNNGQQIDFAQDQENVSPLQGERGNFSPDNPEKDPSERMFIRAGNKRQHPEETDIDNQPLTDEAKPHATPTVNSSGRIISQEQLKELLYPQKPKLSYMKNNP